MTGYAEEFTRVGVEEPDSEKAGKKGRQRRKNPQPKADYTAKGVKRLHSCHRETMVLCFGHTAALSGHWVWRWLHSHYLWKRRSPKGAVDTRKILHAMCFSALAPSDWQSQGQISFPAKRKGASRKEAKTRGILFSIIWRAGYKNEIRCWQQKINICLIHTLYQV